MDTSDQPRPDAIEIADDAEAFAAGDRALNELTPAELDDLERLPAEMAEVGDVDAALAFYDRLAGHDG